MEQAPAHIPEKWANKIYDALVQYVKASESDRSNFVDAASDLSGPGVTTHKIRCLLGTKTIFHNGRALGTTGWFLTYTHSERTPIRDQMLIKANHRLNSIFNDFVNEIDILQLS